LQHTATLQQVSAVEQALAGFDLDDSEMDLIRNDIRRF